MNTDDGQAQNWALPRRPVRVLARVSPIRTGHLPGLTPGAPIMSISEVTSAASPATAGPAAARPLRLPWVLSLTSAAYFMVVLDSLVVATALPRISRDLGVGLATSQWTVNS